MIKTPVASRKRVVDRLARTGRRLAGQVADAAEEQERTLVTLHQELARHGVTPVAISADALDPGAQQAIAGAHLVISVGGDGTLLAASHWVTGAALLGVNSAPRSSVGYLSLTRRSTLARVLARIANGTLQPQPVSRLAVEIDGAHLPPALNDVLVAHEHPASTSRYRLHLGRQREDHRSSGLWIATPAGSTAGIHSAGGQVMPLAARRLQFRARELYRSGGGGAVLETGFVETDQELAVESAMEAGWLFLDGARTATHFPFGAKAIFRIAASPLRLFADPARWAPAVEPSHLGAG